MIGEKFPPLEKCLLDHRSFYLSGYLFNKKDFFMYKINSIRRLIFLRDIFI